MTSNLGDKPPFGPGLAGAAWVAWLAAGSTLAGEAAIDLPTAPEEHMTVQRVLLPVRVQTPWSEPKACAGLSPNELRVYEDDRPALHVEEIEEGWRPTLHLLLLDTSGSMRSQRAFVRDAARRYVERLEEDERAAVFTVGDSLTMRTGVTPDRGRLRRAVDDTASESSTFLWDAIVELTRQFGDRPGRKALVIVTDGVDAGSLSTYDEALAAAASIPEFSIFAVVPAAPVPGTEDAAVAAARERMKALARTTGGEYFLVPDPDFLGRAFLDIRGLLRSEIFVHYVPPGGAEDDQEVEVRRIRVELARGRPHCRLTPARGSRRTDARSRPSGLVAPGWSGTSTNSPLREEGCAGRPTLRVDRNSVAGCTIDAVLDHGLAWDPVLKTTFFRPTPRLAMSRVEFPVPPIAKLPRSPAELVRRWLLEEMPGDLPVRWLDDDTRRAWGDALPKRRPLLPSGTAWLALRRQLGVALEDGYPEYGAWLKRTLAHDAAEYVEVARRALAARGYGPEAIEAETAFRRFEAEAHAADPTPYDAQEGLAAWLGDVSARRLALRVERITIARWLESASGQEEASRIVARWDRLHTWFPSPLDRRVVVLASPILDEPSGRIGFYRVVLPVPTLLADRAWAIKRRFPEVPPDDSVPLRPYALLLLRHLRGDPAFRGRLEAPGVTVRRFRHAVVEPGEEGRRKSRASGHGDAPAELLHRVEIDLRGPSLGEEGLRITALARTAPDGTTTFAAVEEGTPPRSESRGDDPDSD